VCKRLASLAIRRRRSTHVAEVRLPNSPLAQNQTLLALGAPEGPVLFVTVREDRLAVGSERERNQQSHLLVAVGVSLVCNAMRPKFKRTAYMCRFATITCETMENITVSFLGNLANYDTYLWLASKQFTTTGVQHKRFNSEVDGRERQPNNARVVPHAQRFMFEANEQANMDTSTQAQREIEPTPPSQNNDLLSSRASDIERVFFGEHRRTVLCRDWMGLVAFGGSARKIAPDHPIYSM